MLNQVKRHFFKTNTMLARYVLSILVQKPHHLKFVFFILTFMRSVSTFSLFLFGFRSDLFRTVGYFSCCNYFILTF